MSSGEGSLASHSRKREDRSPEVGAVKAPEVNASKVGKSGVLSEDVVTVTQIGWLSPRKGQNGYCDREQGVKAKMG